MSPAQRNFWEGVRDYARAIRRAKKIDLEVAADALALEQEIEERLAADAPLAAVAEERAETTEGR